MKKAIGLAVLAAVVGLGAGGARGDWPTARGNAQRTGNVDGLPGPKAPKVLWVYESTDHYVSAPTPGPSGIVYVPALGTLNSGVMSAISGGAGVANDKRVVWSKSQPFLKLPTVCSPAVVRGRVIFGDGMHQNESPTLYCLDAEKGTSVWQLPIPGALIHLEGTPTVVDGRAYFGAGNGGVMCVDTVRVTVDGKETDAKAVAELMAAQWKAMQEKYEADKKKDPDFAIPPSEDALPKPAPKVLWRQGEGGRWHVDSPVAVAGDFVLAGSAHLDSENSGERGLFCMNRADGSEKWHAPLQLNPWGGPSVDGDSVYVGCSSIRFDPKEINGAKGQVVALNLADGKERWHKDVNGGVVSPVAVSKNGLAIFTATDKKVYALDAKTGEQRWAYEAKAPFFAGVAVAGETVYAADLNGVVHAISLADGKGQWKLDVGKQTKAIGNIYGSPVVDGGRLYVATCNLDSQEARKTVIVCVGEK
jgi:outer membrane protein assembly factor BamB